MEWSRSSTLSRRSFWCKESKGGARSGENRAIPFLQTSPEFRWFRSTSAISVSNEYPDVLKVILRIIWDVSCILKWSVARGAIWSPSTAVVDARWSYSGDQKVVARPFLSSLQSPRLNPPLTKSSQEPLHRRLRRSPVSRRAQSTPGQHSWQVLPTWQLTCPWSRLSACAARIVSVQKVASVIWNSRNICKLRKFISNSF
jgi:hypothetical protein